MKWPAQLTLIRHAESSYNQLRHSRLDHPKYVQFRSLFEDDWQSSATKRAAIEVAQVFSKDNGEDTTGITEHGKKQARDLGVKLPSEIDLPDVIFVSPHLRTRQTLQELQQVWDDLRDVRVIVDDRIREQDFGLRLLYGDWRVMQVFHPEQRPLYQIHGPYWYRQPQGENIADVRSRIRQWQSTLTRDYAGQKVMAITHHISILAFKANIDRLAPDQFISLYKSVTPGNCSISMYENALGNDGRERLASINFNQKL